jgi:class 3 adenylate cyclase/tetratricopeptide (TPR) repeat protein
LDIGTWLRSLGLQRYEEAFRDHHIGAELLTDLTSADLREIGVASLGHRKRLLSAIEALSGSEEASPLAAEPIPSSPEVPGAPAAGGAPAERRQLTVLFCDLVDSAALAVRLDPEDFGGFIRSYQDACAEELGRCGGQVSEFLGDGVLAYFGHPMANEDDADRAVRAGLALVEAVGKLAPPGLPALRARVGIATGLVMVGGGSANGARDRSPVGGALNLAARLQALAEPGAVVVDAGTRRLLEGLFELADLGPLEAKGLPGRVRAWRVLRRPGAPVGSRSEAIHAANAPAPLVGRDEEMELLRRHWKQAVAGEGRAVLLSGEPGIGKSRLASSLVEGLAGEPHARLRYFCAPHHQDSPLAPVVAQLARAAGFDRGETPEARLGKLEALLARTAAGQDDVALIADLLGLPAVNGGGPPLPALNPQRRRERLLGALLAQFAGLAERQPVLVLFEDAHWIDPTTLELLGMAVERLRRLPALLLVTFRPEFRPPWAGLPHVTALALGGLGRRDAAALVERTAGDAALADGVVEKIVERAAGVPLFVEELTRAVVEADAQEADMGSALAAAPLPGSAVPAALHGTLMARLDRLGPAREVAQIGATIGREFTYELLAAVARRPEAELRESLDRLAEAGLVFCTGVPPHATFAFKHALVLDAAYGTLLIARRRELHAAIAQAIETLSPDIAQARPELLAQHFAQAGMAEEAVRRWGAAGKRAIARSAMAEAAAHLRRALEALAAMAETPKRHQCELGLQLELGTALTALHGYAAPETGRVYERARALCEQLGDTPRLVEVAGGQASYHLMRAEVGAALAAAEDLLRRAERDGSLEGRIAAHRLSGIGVFHAGRLEEAREHLEAAAGLLEAAGAEADRLAGGKDALVGVPAHRAAVLGLLGRYGEARKQSRFALAEAERSARPHRSAFTLALVLFFHSLLDEDAPPLLAALDAIAGEQGFAYMTGHAMMFRGLAKARAGKGQEGIALVRAGAALHDTAGAAWAVPPFLSAVAGLAGGREALAVAEEVFARAEGTGVRFFTPELHRVRGSLLADSGDRIGAEADHAEALRIAREQGAKHWELRTACSLARLWRDAGRPGEARELLAPIYGRFDEGLGTPDLRRAEALLRELA